MISASRLVSSGLAGVFGAAQLGIVAAFLSPVLSVQTAHAQSNCLGISHLPGYTLLQNYCSSRISVYWRDQRYCSTGCMSSIAPGSRDSATSWTGQYSYCICWEYDRCCDP